MALQSQFFDTTYLILEMSQNVRNKKFGFWFLVYENFR